MTELVKRKHYQIYQKEVNQMNIGIIGTRRRNATPDFLLVKNKFKEINEVYGGDWIVSGGCPKGADSFAEEIARDLGIPILIFHANWKFYGKGAGFVRNTDIADNSDILIACVADDRKGGTEDTIKKFLKRKNEDYLVLV